MSYDENWQTCPFHEGPVVSPCEVPSCDLWAERAPKHCACLLIQGREQEEMRWEEIAHVVGQSVEAVEALAKEAYSALRQQTIQESITPEWVLLRNAKRCVVCSRPATRFENGWGWCHNPACYDWMPPAIVEIEARWGTWLRRLGGQWKNLNLRTIERLTGLSRPLVQWLRWQHFGWDDEGAPAHWAKRSAAPLIRNPQVPTADQLLKRLEGARRWSG